MSTTLIEVRPAKAADAGAVATTHDDAWRAAYQGIIPGAELAKLINRRGPQWWTSRSERAAASACGVRREDRGLRQLRPNRARSLHFEGEIYELDLRPEFQGLGFGRLCSPPLKRDLGQSGLKSMVVWALSDNDPPPNFIAPSAAAWWPAPRSASGRSRSTRSPPPGRTELAIACF